MIPQQGTVDMYAIVLIESNFGSEVIIIAKAFRTFSELSSWNETQFFIDRFN
jgi:hypothetical protein